MVKVKWKRLIIKDDKVFRTHVDEGCFLTLEQAVKIIGSWNYGNYTYAIINYTKEPMDFSKLHASATTMRHVG